MLEFNGQVAIVTGSGSPRGIGRCIASTLARQGATVIVADINEVGIKETVDIITKDGGKADGFKLDVTSEESVNDFVKKVMDKYGRIDVLVNNAGISQKITVADMTLDDMKRIFNVNMFGLFLITKACAAIMTKAKYGRIVSLSSVSAKRGGGVFGGAHYSASKAAILGFSKNLAREVAEYGVTVNCVCPGAINTDIRKAMAGSEEDDKRLAQDIPMKRIGLREEVADTIVFLASKEAGYITGEDIDINGGSHMD